LRFLHWFFFLAFILLTIGVVHCALATSPDLQQINWIPSVIASWANSYPSFRNFPAFAVVAMSLFFCVFSCLQKPHPPKHFGLVFFCSIVVSLFGVLLECLQIWLPARVFDPYDIAWSVTGAFAGSCLAFSVSILLNCKNKMSLRSIF
jgi:hypothetical protein